jgi:lincosamide nucleotidyltransferase A/C/D/E
MMTAEQVLAVTRHLVDAGIAFWLDGGWGVDALLGEQTRGHDDLDVVVRLDAAEQIIRELGAAGFAVDLDERPTRFVMADTAGGRIDFHPVVFDEHGGARQIGAGPNGGDAPYPADGFAGQGSIGGQPVQCLTPQLLVRHHTGYSPKDKDWHNVSRLCERFGVPIPRSYAGFATGPGVAGEKR